MYRHFRRNTRWRTGIISKARKKRHQSTLTQAEKRRLSICTTGGSEQDAIDMWDSLCTKCLGCCMDGCDACGGSGWKEDQEKRKKNDLQGNGI